MIAPGIVAEILFAPVSLAQKDWSEKPGALCLPSSNSKGQAPK